MQCVFIELPFQLSIAINIYVSGLIVRCSLERAICGSAIAVAPKRADEKGMWSSVTRAIRSIVEVI